jgi:hypothetical protein
MNITRKQLTDIISRGSTTINEGRCFDADLPMFGWKLHVRAVYNTPRGGAMRAWKSLYYLIDPKGCSFGGYDRKDSFVSWAVSYLNKQVQL